MSELQSISLFSGLANDTLSAIDRLTTTRQYPKNSIIINEGDVSNSMYLLMEGRVKVYLSEQDGREFILNNLQPGDHFGEFALLDDEKRTASIMTVEPSIFKILLKADFDRLRHEYAEINDVLIGNLVGTIRHLTENVKSLALKDVYGRIRQLLHQLPKNADGRIEEKLTQQEIANRVGSSREMVARILKNLITGGYIHIEKKQITLLKPLPEHY
ncbi:MAG: Crp/Fnr family transcriptional regulator [Gammaproteobacteria bacterium]